ncbi:MAG: MFS transporter [Actinobacteria bacterium]|nr:MFS transporter [Actinomycetota bacterium]
MTDISGPDDAVAPRAAAALAGDQPHAADPVVAPAAPRHEAEADPKRWIVLAVLCVNLVLVVAAVSSANVALPTLARSLGASQTELQWIVDAYALVFAGLLLPAGAIGDRFGRKGALQVGLGIFILFSLAAALSGGAGRLIAARAAMGFGAALIMPTTLSVLSNVFPPHERAKAIAIWAGFAGAGGAIGPLMGGWLLSHFFWGSVFLINVVIGGIALVAGALLVPTSRDPQNARLDPVGAALSVLGLGSFVFAVIEGPEKGWRSPVTLFAFAVAAVGIAAFVRYERRRRDPMLDIGLFAKRPFTTGVVTISMAFFSLFGMFFVVTQYFQFVLGWSPLKAGVAQIPNALAMVLVAPRSTKVIARIGQRAAVVSGLAMHATGFVILSTAGRSSSYLPVLVGLVLIGTGSGITFAPTTAMIMAAVPLRRAGMGSGVNDAAREVGGAIGIAVLGSILTTAYRSGVAPLLVGLRETDAGAARRSISQAIGVSRSPSVSPQRGAALADGARAAFVDGMYLTLRFGAVTALVCAVLVWWLSRGAGTGGTVVTGRGPGGH